MAKLKYYFGLIGRHLFTTEDSSDEKDEGQGVSCECSPEAWLKALRINKAASASVWEIYYSRVWNAFLFSLL